MPELNAVWDGERVVPSPAIHVGVAISLRQGGLIAPALHDTDRQSLGELMAKFRDLVSRARAGSLRGSELSDPTITVTSLGEQGVETVFPIIYPPQVAIVGFGKVVERPWVVDGPGGRPTRRDRDAVRRPSCQRRPSRRAIPRGRGPPVTGAEQAMTTDDIRAAVLQRASAASPPKPTWSSLKPDVGFREQLDIDSMDFLNFVIALHKELHVEIPEKDYPKLATLQAASSI